jgi:hypothetical protein
MKYVLLSAALMIASPAQAEVVFVLTSDVIDSNGVGGGVQTGANFIAVDGYSFVGSFYPDVDVNWSAEDGAVSATANKLSLSGLSLINHSQTDPVWFDIGFSVADLYSKPGGFFRTTFSGTFTDGGGNFSFWVDDRNEQVIPINSFSSEGDLARGSNVDGLSASGGTFFRTHDTIVNSFDPGSDPYYYPYSMSSESYIGLAQGGSLTNLSMSIQYIAAPEPSTWALVMLGFGVIAFSQMTPRIRRLNRPGARISDVPNPPTM